MWLAEVGRGCEMNVGRGYNLYINVGHYMQSLSQYSIYQKGRTYLVETMGLVGQLKISDMKVHKGSIAKQVPFFDNKKTSGFGGFPPPL